MSVTRCSSAPQPPPVPSSPAPTPELQTAIDTSLLQPSTSRLPAPPSSLLSAGYLSVSRVASPMSAASTSRSRLTTLVDSRAPSECGTSHTDSRGGKKVNKSHHHLSSSSSKPYDIPKAVDNGKDKFTKQEIKQMVEELERDDRKCPVESCLVDLSSPGALKRHLRTVHLAQRPWICEHCNKVLSRQDAWKRHVNICRARKGKMRARSESSEAQPHGFAEAEWQ
ncbi:hypothetical protein BKA62DRAFT_696697 [Auriculariales sp. MPI-PUGE-AT-0066]|nr:hypothetical protein BKA62DRAFT_696697 [Auriculariales sp. MPI-PUGE-AT-0066]